MSMTSNPSSASVAGCAMSEQERPAVPDQRSHQGSRSEIASSQSGMAGGWRNVRVCLDWFCSMVHPGAVNPLSLADSLMNMR